MAITIDIKIDGRDKIETEVPTLSGAAMAEAVRRVIGRDYWLDRVAFDAWDVRDLQGRIVGYARPARDSRGRPEWSVPRLGDGPFTL